MLVDDAAPLVTVACREKGQGEIGEATQDLLLLFDQDSGKDQAPLWSEASYKLGRQANVLCSQDVGKHQIILPGNYIKGQVGNRYLLGELVLLDVC